MRRRVLMMTLLVLSAATAGRAQGMAPVSDADPPAYPLRLGPLRLAPGLRVRQVGIDSNIFQEAAAPREDFVVSFTPDVNFYLRPRGMRVSAYLGSDFNYFHEYSDERFIAPTARGRVDLLFGLFRPYAGGGRTDTQERPNREIDARARRLDTEYGGGLAFGYSAVSFYYVSATHFANNYAEAQVFEGVDLEQSLDKVTMAYDAGARLSLTPLTSLSLVAGYSEDRFTYAVARDASSRYGYGELIFSSDAIIRGTARLGVRDFEPEDPALDPYLGLIAQVALVYPVLDRGSFAFAFVRDVTYSFEQVEGYYVDTTADLTYTHRLYRGWDAQGRIGWSRLGYAAVNGAGDRNDGMRVLSGGFGYNFADRSRLGFTYEWSRRSSDERPDREYDRRRVFASWAFTF